MLLATLGAVLFDFDVVADFLRPSGFGAGFEVDFVAPATSSLSDLLLERLIGLFSTSSSSSGTGDSGRLPFALVAFEAGALPLAFEAGVFPFALDVGAFDAGAFDAGFEAVALGALLDAGALDEGFEAATFASAIFSSMVDSGFPRDDLRVRPAIPLALNSL